MMSDTGYQYHMVQVPPNIRVKNGETRGAAAGYLEDIVNQEAAQGWEFYSIETIGIVENPGCGCLAALFGVKPQRFEMYVIVFRALKPIEPT